MKNRFVCMIFGHKYYVIRRLGEKSSQIGCEYCSDKWVLHTGIKLMMPWDSDFEMLCPENDDLNEQPSKN